MKEPWKWTEEDLLALIETREQESLTLDYKRCDALQKNDDKKKDISKDVSAFANSAGGTLVYGMVEDGHVPTAFDYGFDPNEISKEWLEHVITSRIQRRIDGIRINPVRLDSRQGRMAYVVWVPQSLRAPHQASDKRFYRRYNFESVPMEEYEVRDVTHRSLAPDIRLRVDVKESSSGSLSGYCGGSVELSVKMYNQSRAIAQYALITLLVDSRLTLDAPEFREGEVSLLEHLVRYPRPKRFSLDWAVPHRMPLWEGIEQDLGCVCLTFPEGSGEYFFGWSVDSPNMETRRGNLLLQVVGDLLLIAEAPEPGEEE